MRKIQSVAWAFSLLRRRIVPLLRATARSGPLSDEKSRSVILATSSAAASKAP
jgi:hypothetical protein